jgi:hypothetical protein
MMIFSFDLSAVQDFGRRAFIIPYSIFDSAELVAGCGSKELTGSLPCKLRTFGQGVS